MNLRFKPYSYIIEADIKGFFDNMGHKWMMKMLALCCITEEPDAGIPHVRIVWGRLGNWLSYHDALKSFCCCPKENRYLTFTMEEKK